MTSIESLLIPLEIPTITCDHCKESYVIISCQKYTKYNDTGLFLGDDIYCPLCGYKAKEVNNKL